MIILQEAHGILEDWKDVTTIISSIVSTVAILIGGIFAWRRWGRELPEEERGDLRQLINIVQLDEGQQLVHVTLVIKNRGTVSLLPIEAYTLIEQIVPIHEEVKNNYSNNTLPVDETGTTYAWPILDRQDYPVKEDQLRIDSGEEELLHSEFIVPTSVQAFSVYSLVSMDKDDPDLAWEATNLVDRRTMIHAESSTPANTQNNDVGNVKE